MRNLVVRSHVTKELSQFVKDEKIEGDFLPAKVTTDFDYKGHLPDNLYLWNINSPSRLDSSAMTIKPLHNLTMFRGSPDNDTQEMMFEADENLDEPIGLEFDGNGFFCAHKNGDTYVVKEDIYNPVLNFDSVDPLQCIKLDPQYEILALVTKPNKLLITPFTSIVDGQIAEVQTH